MNNMYDGFKNLQAVCTRRLEQLKSGAEEAYDGEKEQLISILTTINTTKIKEENHATTI